MVVKLNMFGVSISLVMVSGFIVINISSFLVQICFDFKTFSFLKYNFVFYREKGPTVGKALEKLSLKKKKIRRRSPSAHSSQFPK